MALRRPKDSSARRGAASSLLIVGLANPGAEYERSRHNVGGEAVSLLASRIGASLTSERRQRCASGSATTPIGLVTLAVPKVYVNESGSVLPPLMRRTSISAPEQIVIVHDELDFDLGRLQLKRGGGLAGHNGLRSIAATLHSQEFVRLRIGIGKPHSKDQGADWVLRPLSGRQRTEMLDIIESAAEALELVCREGVDAAQPMINLS